MHTIIVIYFAKIQHSIYILNVHFMQMDVDSFDFKKMYEKY